MRKGSRDEASGMRMKEMVRRTRVHERLLRYYEQQGLLTPERLPSGYRVYGGSDVETGCAAFAVCWRQAFRPL